VSTDYIVNNSGSLR